MIDRSTHQSLALLCEHSGPSPVFGPSGEMRPLCVDVSVLTSEPGCSRRSGVAACGRWTARRLPRSVPVPPRQAPPLRPLGLLLARPRSCCAPPAWGGTTRWGRLGFSSPYLTDWKTESPGGRWLAQGSLETHPWRPRAQGSGSVWEPCAALRRGGGPGRLCL